MLIDIKMKKKLLKELGHSDRLISWLVVLGLTAL